jgi:hypothetical protein
MRKLILSLFLTLLVISTSVVPALADSVGPPP